MVSIMEMGLAANKIAEGVMWLIDALNKGIGNYGVAVICFTLILKLAMSPFDVWQKVVMTKNNRAMERMKPQLEKLQQQYAGNKELYSQKQMELYRKEKYSMLGSCLPSIISLVIFFMVFSGFNGMVKQYNINMYKDLSSSYYSTYETQRAAAYTAEYNRLINDGKSETEADESATIVAKETATTTAQNAVVSLFDDKYKKEIKFMWVNNVFMPDSWKNPIPVYETFVGKGIGNLDIDTNSIEHGNPTEYGEVMAPLIAKYNQVKRNGKSGSRWNGFMLLPIITGLITFASTKLMKQTQPPQPPTANGSGKDMQNAMQANMKMMQWFMPILLAVFALLYSTAFTVYMVISNLFSTVFQLIYNACVKVNDKRNEEKRLESTFK